MSWTPLTFEQLTDEMLHLSQKRKSFRQGHKRKNKNETIKNNGCTRSFSSARMRSDEGSNFRSLQARFFSVNELHFSFGPLAPSRRDQRSTRPVFHNPPDFANQPATRCLTFFIPVHFATPRKVPCMFCHSSASTRRLVRMVVSTFQAGSLLCSRRAVVFQVTCTTCHTKSPHMKNVEIPAE